MKTKIKTKMKKVIKNIFFQKPIINHFNTSYSKRVLISYITDPFKQGIKNTHSNKIEAIKIAYIFHKMKFIVDIYQYTYNKEINQNEYNVVFGIGKCYDKLVSKKQNNIIYISYATGAYFCFANMAEHERLQNLYKRKNIILDVKRFIKNPTYYASQYSDAMITTGNTWTVSTYINSKMPIYTVPVSVYNIDWKDSFIKDFNKNRNNYLWFGSSGLVHKGLDLCLEVFKDLPKHNLYICGPKEDNFFRVYEKELQLPNIHYLGFMDINSKSFQEVIEKCVFSIFPSCSEGGGGALLTTMSVGLIPIATLQASVNLENKGFYIKANIPTIKETILKSSELEEKELIDLSIKNKEFINKNHKINHFENKMLKNLITIIGEKNG